MTQPYNVNKIGRFFQKFVASSEYLNFNWAMVAQGYSRVMYSQYNEHFQIVNGKKNWMRCRPFWQYLLKKSIIYKKNMSSMGAKNLQFAICSFYARKKLSWRRRKFLLRAISHSVISWTPLCTSYATKWVREPIWVQNLIQTQYRYVPLDCSLDLLKIVPKQLEFLVAVQGIALVCVHCAAQQYQITKMFT